MAVLVIADHDNRRLSPATASAVAAASQLGGDIACLVAGSDCAAVADAAARLSGVTRVLLCDAPHYAHQLAEPMAELIAPLARDVEHVVFPSTTSGKNIAPRLCALLDAMLIADIIAIEAEDRFVRPIYAGAALATVKSIDAIRVLTIRASAFDPVGLQSACPIETIDPAADPARSEWIGDEFPQSARPDLQSARIVVSGGRALGSGENFRLIEALADTLGAAIGASRAAVDAGYAPNDWQVGQTGKIVAPDLYIAVGISGALQHLAGMSRSKIIVAIDKDPEAPIFKIADYGLVADLFEAVPALVAELDKKPL